MAEFGADLPLAVVTRVALQAKRDLACSPTGALPELIERLARQRLLVIVTEQRQLPKTDAATESDRP
jgi:hypothetical protein